MPFKDVEETEVIDADGRRPMVVHVRPSRRWDLHGSTLDAERCLSCPANVKNGGLEGVVCTGVDPVTGRGSIEYPEHVRGVDTMFGNHIANQTTCGVRVNDLEWELELNSNHKSTKGKAPREVKRTRKVWYPNSRS